MNRAALFVAAGIAGALVAGIVVWTRPAPVERLPDAVVVIAPAASPSPDTAVADLVERAWARWRERRRAFVARAKPMIDELHLIPTDSVRNAAEVAPGLKVAIDEAAELVRGLDAAHAPAPAYGEAIALVHAVFDALGRLTEPDVRTHLGEPLARLESAVRATPGAAEPRITLTELVTVRLVMETSLQRFDMLGRYAKIVGRLSPTPPALWSVTVAAARARLAVAAFSSVIWERAAPKNDPVARRAAWTPYIEGLREERHRVTGARLPELARHAAGLAALAVRPVSILREAGAAPRLREELAECTRALIAALTERQLPAGGDRDALAAELAVLEAELAR